MWFSDKLFKQYDQLNIKRKVLDITIDKKILNDKLHKINET